MKILHIQYSMTPAGNAAYRLNCSMRSEGLDSKVLLLGGNYEQNDCEIIKVSPIRKLIRKCINAAYSYFLYKNKKEGTYYFSSLPQIGVNITNNKLVQEADVVYIHWVAGMSLSKKDFKELSNKKRLIILFMHDMWDLTAGCHHSFDCEQYISGCQNCPLFFARRRSIRKLLFLKEESFRGENIIFVSPGQWLASCAEKSMIARKHQIYVIPNIVNQSIFRPIDKEKARQYFKLPLNKRIISFGCISGENPFKGWTYLKEAINNLSIQDLHVVVYGGDYKQETSDELKYPVSFIGRITSEEELGLISNVADVFINPSLCENYSSVLLEHILCKVPVVAFNYTGNPDLVKTGVTGYLAEYKNSMDLSNGISLLLNGDIKPTFDFDYSSDEIIRLHKSMIDNHYLNK